MPSPRTAACACFIAILSRGLADSELGHDTTGISCLEVDTYTSIHNILDMHGLPVPAQNLLAVSASCIAGLDLAESAMFCAPHLFGWPWRHQVL